MNGFSTGEEDSRGPTDQICCLVDCGDRCTRAAGNASYSKRIQKNVTHRRMNLSIDTNVSHVMQHIYIILLFNLFTFRPGIFTYVIIIKQ